MNQWNAETVIGAGKIYSSKIILMSCLFGLNIYKTMIRLLLSTFLLMLIVSFSPINKPLLNKKQTYSLFGMMISDIEYFDAEMRLTRDNNKEVSWEDYKAFHEKNWNKSVSPKELKKLFLQFRNELDISKYETHPAGQNIIVDGLPFEDQGIPFPMPQQFLEGYLQLPPFPVE